MRQIFGYKRGMTRLFMEDGSVLAVTAIEVKPCRVVQVKTEDKDGYNALQLGFGERRKNLFNKPQLGHFGEAGPTRHLREVRLDAPAEVSKGDAITVDIFKPGERVDITGVSKGLGFQGGVRRHGFKGGQTTHGQSDRMRAPGSIGQASYPSRVFKGISMAGRMGNRRVTVRNLGVVSVRPEDNLIFIEGAVPGKNNAVLSIQETNKR